MPRSWIPIVVLGLTACIASRIGRPIHPGELSDGIYYGKASRFPNSAKVKVVIEEGRITIVEIVRHAASSIGHAADGVVPGLIVLEQSTSVDAVTGATNSSNVIMNAAEHALMCARGMTEECEEE